MSQGPVNLLTGTRDSLCWGAPQCSQRFIGGFDYSRPSPGASYSLDACAFFLQYGVEGRVQRDHRSYFRFVDEDVSQPSPRFVKDAGVVKEVKRIVEAR